jgi:hypothetical protein
MRVRTGVLFALVALACCGEREGAIELSIPTLPGDGSELRMFDSRGGAWWNYRVHWKAQAPREVQLAARFRGAVPEGMELRLKGESKLRIGGEGIVTLVVVMPKAFGPIQGEIEFYSDDLPGWTKVFPFRGEVVDKPRRGRYIQAQPAGVQLGKLRPGETKPFRSTLKNVGDEDITIRDWKISDTDIVKVRGLLPNQVLAPGAELEVGGEVLVPRLAVSFREKIRIFTDAENYPGGIDITLLGEVDPDYSCQPKRLEVRADYPIRETTYPVEIVARKGGDPFVVESVSGHEAYFVVGELSKTPATRQRIEFKVKPNAPTSVTERQEFDVRFRLAPGHVDVIWPVSITLLPPIHPSPPRLNFGRVPIDRPARLELRLHTFANRKFKVTKAYTEKGRFAISEAHGGEGLTWSYFVAPARNLRVGLHRDTLVIETDDKDVPIIRVPIYLELH